VPAGRRAPRNIAQPPSRYGTDRTAERTFDLLNEVWRPISAGRRRASEEPHQLTFRPAMRCRLAPAQTGSRSGHQDGAGRGSNRNLTNPICGRVREAAFSSTVRGRGCCRPQRLGARVPRRRRVLRSAIGWEAIADHPGGQAAAGAATPPAKPNVLERATP
jgi:hypothetical protein